MEKNKQQTDIITENFVSDIRTIIEQGRKQAYAATGQIAIMTYWNIGRVSWKRSNMGQAGRHTDKSLFRLLRSDLLLNTGPVMVGAIWHITENSIWNSRM